MLNVAIVGATGLVGETFLDILQETDFPINQLFPLASHRSAGEKVEFKGEQLVVQDIEDFDFSQVQIAFFSAGAEVSEKYAPIAASANCVVIDNTSCFRNDEDVPLVIPEVNPEKIALYDKRNIIANPNCSTIQMLVALKPIYDAVGITRINVATYQSVSGTGKNAIRELGLQSAQVLNGQAIDVQVYPIAIAFNLIPHIDVFESNGYTKEEMKMVRETKKILDDEEIMVNATCVRVPVFYGHSEAVHIETRFKITAQEAKILLSKAPGVIVKDELGDRGYPSPLEDAADKNEVFVGRIREDISHPLGLDLWVVADNIRKGAALNSVQIAQILVRDYF